MSDSNGKREVKRETRRDEFTPKATAPARRRSAKNSLTFSKGCEVNAQVNDGPENYTSFLKSQF